MRYLLPLLLLLVLAPQSAPPALPACTQAQHARYSTRGPDGRVYATWHPQIDYAQGCINDHEHGSAPYIVAPAVPFNEPSTTAAHWPAFGYTAGAMGMSEGHAGFKTVLVRVDGVWWLITMHQGTGNAALAACTRYHTLDVQAYDAATGARLADLHTMADFGQAHINRTGALIGGCAQPPANNGVRLLPSMADGDMGYEPWQADPTVTAAGFSAGRFTLTAHQPQTACQDAACLISVPRADGSMAANGVWRTVELFPGFGISGIISGTFATDAHGMALVAPGTPGAVVQQVAPGWSFRLASARTCAPYGIDMVYNCAGALTNDQQYRRNPFIGGAN